jgi:hypothetical protein
MRRYLADTRGLRWRSAAAVKFIGRMKIHRDFDLYSLLPTFGRAGLEGVDSGPLGFSDLHYVAARKPDELAAQNLFK